MWVDDGDSNTSNVEGSADDGVGDHVDVTGMPVAGQPRKPGRGAKRALLVSAAVVALVASTIVAYVSLRDPPQRVGAADVQLSDGQVKLPFNDLDHPIRIAVDAAGVVYVTDQPAHRVQRLLPGAESPETLPFPNLGDLPHGLAVSSRGDVYAVDDGETSEILHLPKGTTTPIRIRLDGLRWPMALAVGPDDALYVVDGETSVLYKLAVGASEPQTRAIDMESSLSASIAVDASEAIYIASGDTVAKIPAGSQAAVKLPFPKPANDGSYSGIAVDKAGNVFVGQSDAGMIFRLDAATQEVTRIPFAGSGAWGGIAVDTQGFAYIADYNENRVSRISTP